MSYLDELSSIFGNPADDAIDTVVEVEGETPFEIARRQLAESRTGFHEGPEGTFRACGCRFGCGYAEACVVVDPQTGLADVDINGNVRVSPARLKDARKLCRSLNQAFILPGLMVDDDGWLHFHPERPCNLNEDEGDLNLAGYIGKGFSTIHAHAHAVAQLEAGRKAWDVMRSLEKDDDDEDDERDAALGGFFGSLRRMMS